MNRIELEAAAEERLFDAMLAEVVQQAPVRGRAGASRWLAAALVLLGLAVVAGVVLTARTGSAPAAAPQDPAPLPPKVIVRGIAGLRLADRDIENLSCAIEGPDFGVLSEFEHLRVLHVEQDHDLPHPTLVQAAWSLAPLAQCTKLESLSIGPLARFTSKELAPIVALPNLRLLQIAGGKTIDADLAAVLGKLPLRSLVLDAVHLRPEGLRAIGELPLLERLELRDCTGLDRCDLKHLYRLRQLRALTLTGVGRLRMVTGGPARPGEPISITLPEIKDGKYVLVVSGEWMRGLAKALPDLRELDFADSRVDGELFGALPRTLVSLGMRGVQCQGPSGIETTPELPELRALACGDSSVVGIPISDSSSAPVPWLPLLQRTKLHRFQLTGDLTSEVFAALREQTELRQVRLAVPTRSWVLSDFRAELVERHRPETPVDLACLGKLPHLEQIDLVLGFEAHGGPLEQAIRQAVGDRVRIVVSQPGR